MKAKRGLRVKDKLSKTDRIASIFSSRPLESISPKEIAKELELDLQLVTSIVSRLRSEGLVERVGWGKYKLKVERSVGDDYLIKINKDLREMASMIIGKKEPFVEIDSGGDPFKELTQLYSTIKELGGETLASNLLRLCAKKSHLEEKVDILVESVGEVVRE